MVKNVHLKIELKLMNGENAMKYSIPECNYLYPFKKNMFQSARKITALYFLLVLVKQFIKKIFCKKFLK